MRWSRTIAGETSESFLVLELALVPAMSGPPEEGSKQIPVADLPVSDKVLKKHAANAAVIFAGHHDPLQGTNIISSRQMHYLVRFLTFTSEQENLVTTPLHKRFDAILEDMVPSNRETVVQMLFLSPRP